MMARDSRKVGGRSIKRRVATRRPRKTLLIFCEGERTEPEYLDALKRLPSVRDVAAVGLRVETRQGGSVPRTLVAIATAARSRAIEPQSARGVQSMLRSLVDPALSGAGRMAGQQRRPKASPKSRWVQR